MKYFGNLALRIAICIAVTWVAADLMHLGLVGVILVSPIWGVMLTKPLLEFFPALERIIHRHALQEWEGKFYRYGQIHLRAYFDGDEAWFDAKDVLSVLDKTPATWRDMRYTPQEYGVIPGRREMGFTPAGVIKLTQLSEHAEAPKFRLWFERAVIFTLDKKKSANAAP